MLDKPRELVLWRKTVKTDGRIQHCVAVIIIAIQHIHVGRVCILLWLLLVHHSWIPSSPTHLHTHSPTCPSHPHGHVGSSSCHTWSWSTHHLRITGILAIGWILRRRVHHVALLTKLMGVVMLRVRSSTNLPHVSRLLVEWWMVLWLWSRCR